MTQVDRLLTLSILLSLPGCSLLFGDEDEWAEVSKLRIDHPSSDLSPGDEIRLVWDYEPNEGLFGDYGEKVCWFEYRGVKFDCDLESEQHTLTLAGPANSFDGLEFLKLRYGDDRGIAPAYLNNKDSFDYYCMVGSTNFKELKFGRGVMETWQQACDFVVDRSVSKYLPDIAPTKQPFLVLTNQRYYTVGPINVTASLYFFDDRLGRMVFNSSVAPSAEEHLEIFNRTVAWLETEYEIEYANGIERLRKSNFVNYYRDWSHHSTWQHANVLYDINDPMTKVGEVWMINGTVNFALYDDRYDKLAERNSTSETMR